MTESIAQIVFVSPGRAELRVAPPGNWRWDDPALSIVETEFSVVSAGTELAILSGGEDWAPLPFVPGYGSVGRIVRGPNEGQRVFTHGDHARCSPVRVVCVPLPDGIDPTRAVFARLASVSITALRVSDSAFDDCVAVFGLGLVGNFAAQLFGIAGCEVIGIDPSPRRRAEAAACGIAHTLAPGDDLPVQVRELTGGRMCHTVIEATGVPAVALNAGKLAAPNGELILLGSPRGQLEADIVPLLNLTHLWGNGCVTVRGAHEWRFPQKADPQHHTRYSFEDNTRTLLRLIATGRLRIDPLLTHVAAPADCQAVYDGLRERKDEFLGVVFDWTKL